MSEDELPKRINRNDELVIEESSFVEPLRWFLFVPVYFAILFLLNGTGSDFITYFIAIVLSNLVATFIAPKARLKIIIIFSCVTVLPLVLPIFGTLYSFTQVLYMVVASVISIVAVTVLESRSKRLVQE